MVGFHPKNVEHLGAAPERGGAKINGVFGLVFFFNKLKKYNFQSQRPEGAVGMATVELFLFLTTALLFLGGGSSGAAGMSAVGRRPPPPAAKWGFLRRKRDQEPPSYLKWVAFDGRLPADAVSNWNGYAKRLEYVCSTTMLGCNTGAYVPARGPFCFFPYREREMSTKDFKVLVNMGDLEALDWVDESFGSVPENAVEGCPSVDVFVGRNRYGLGKVVKMHRSLFVVVDQEEVWYKWYQVLVVKKGPADVTISNVHYNMSGAVEHREDVTLMKTTVRNEGCQGVWKTVTLEEATEMEIDHDWEMDQRVFATIRGVLEAPLLVFNETGWEVTNVTSIPWVGRASIGKYVDHTHVVEKEVQAQMACTVALEGHRLDVHIPFTAQLTRDFGDAHPHRVAVTGWARSRAVVGVRPTVKECWPLTDVPPCRG
uniref:NATT4 protein n=1 Tax=Calidris pygmaea TaxID=425635 RepID=A0A8C3JKA2_9CHAR